MWRRIKRTRMVGSEWGSELGSRGMLGASVGVCAGAMQGSQTVRPVACLAAQPQCECGRGGVEAGDTGGVVCRSRVMDAVLCIVVNLIYGVKKSNVYVKPVKGVNVKWNRNYIPAEQMYRCSNSPRSQKSIRNVFFSLIRWWQWMLKRTRPGFRYCNAPVMKYIATH